MTKHKIKTAYDAWWFLYYHPDLQRPYRSKVEKSKAQKMKRQGFIITKDRSGQHWRIHRHGQTPAIIENLDIFYTKTDGRRINDDPSKNVHMECWLEFGKVEYEYYSDWDKDTHEMHYHDWRLDTGGSTFDEALVRLAKRVRKFYGDYAFTTSGEARKGECGKPVCADCKSLGMFLKSHEVEKQPEKTTPGAPKPA